MFKFFEKINQKNEGEKAPLEIKEELEKKQELAQNMDILEDLNKKMETEELSPEEIEDVFKQMVDVEGKLDMLENELKLSPKEAIKVMNDIQNGKVDFEKEMAELEAAMQAEGVSESDKESFLKKMVNQAEGSKKVMRAAAFVLLMSLGTATFAQGAEKPYVNVDSLKITNSLELQQNAGIFALQLNTRGDQDAKGTWLRLNLAAGSPKTGENLGTYVERALATGRTVLTQEQVDHLIQQF